MENDIKLEAAAFRRLINHLKDRNDVQNIDMMNLAGFCRNCLSRWYQEASLEAGIEISHNESRKIVYGMDYIEWKKKYQTDASPEQTALYKKNHS